jgi:hypothetical protein
VLTIDEHLRDDGTPETTRLDLVEGRLRVSVGDAVTGELPLRAIEVVMNRYAKPLDEAESADADAPSLDLGEGRALRMLRHRARYDVIARDFLVFVRPDAPPVAELSTSIAAALVHLARAAQARPG